MFQRAPALFQVTPHVWLFETLDKVSVNSNSNHDVYNINNLCLSNRIEMLMMIFSASCYLTGYLN